MRHIIKTVEQYQTDYKRSVENPEAFWAKLAKTFTWHKPWDKVLEWDFVTHDVKWFQNGKLNITENALDRHVAKHPNKAAIIWKQTARMMQEQRSLIANCTSKSVNSQMS
jgi:acetyl-CoA synthetase